MEIGTKKLKDIKKAYKEWCGLDLNLSECTFESIKSQIKFTKQLMIDEAEQEADRMINILYRVNVTID